MNKEGKGYRNKLNYIKEYNRLNSKVISFHWHKEKDADVIEWLNQQPLKADYFRKLIREDIKRNKK